jgi:hypothetical protein
MNEPAPVGAGESEWRMKRSLFCLLLFVSMACADEPHLFYRPDGTMRLRLTPVVPKEFRLCAVGNKFTFCSEWRHPKSREVEVDIAIPRDTPNGEYKLFYEDRKHRRVDLRDHFQVEK